MSQFADFKMVVVVVYIILASLSSLNGEEDKNGSDIAVSKDLSTIIEREETSVIASAGLRSLKKRWPEGKVLYKFHSSLSSNTRRKVRRAMDKWSAKTCITFTEITNGNREKDHVTITSQGPGCSTECLGYCKKGSKLNLETPRCTKIGTILHELGHVIGLWHEQNRPDRDNFVRINLENVKPDMKINFYKHSKEEVDNEDLVYDYGSIMHYNEYSFSRNGKKTMEVTNLKVYRDEGSPRVGQRKKLSQGDINVVNRMCL